MIPSIPRFKMPERSVKTSPTAAYTRGVATRKVAVINPTRNVTERTSSMRLLLGSTAPAAQGEPVTLQHEHSQCNQQQGSLEHVAQIGRHTQGAAYGLGAGVHQADEQSRGRYADGVQRAQGGDDDAGVAITRREGIDQVKVDASYLTGSRQTPDAPADQGHNHDGPVNMDARKARCFHVQPYCPHLQ